MSEILNLNRARKSKTRATSNAVAAENRVKFGVRQSQKAWNRAKLAKSERSLDQSLSDR